MSDDTRPLGFGALLALGVNGVVGVGIFFAPSEIAAHVGARASVAVFAATALGLLPVALMLARVARAFDEDGGPIVHARAAFGDRAAEVVGVLAYVSALFSTAATLVGLSHATTPAFARALGDGDANPAALERALAVGLALLFAAVAARGVKVSARVWSALTVGKLVPLAALVLAAAAALALGGAAAGLAPAGPHAFTTRDALRAALTATFTYQGFEIVPLVAGKAKAPARDVPRAVVLSLALAALLYVALSAACALGVPDLAHEGAPLAAAAETFGGPRMGSVVRAGTSVSALGIVFGMITMTPRYLAKVASVSRPSSASGDAPWLARETARGAPLAALAVTLVLVVALVVGNSLAQLFTLASLSVVGQYALSALSLLRLSLRKSNGFGREDAVVAGAGLAVTAGLAAGATAHEFVVAFGLVGAGIFFVHVRSWLRARRAAA